MKYAATRQENINNNNNYYKTGKSLFRNSISSKMNSLHIWHQLMTILPLTINVFTANAIDFSTC